MGIDAYAFNFLGGLPVEAGPRRAMMLGRQAINRPAERSKVVRSIARLAGKAEGARADAKSFEFVEQAMAALGYGVVDSLDFSDYQGANLLHDLAQPLPATLHGRYDLVYDGGTTEHIFDLPTVFANVDALLRTGGVFVSANAMNGAPGHGLYQFCPELVWSYWKRARGYQVLACRAQPVDKADEVAPFDLPDMGVSGKRLRIGHKLPAGRVYLFYAVQKTQAVDKPAAVRQGDYVGKWASAAAEGQAPAAAGKDRQ